MKKPFFIFLLSCAAFFSAHSGIGRMGPIKDSLLPEAKILNRTNEEPLIAGLLNIESGHRLSGEQRKAFLHLLRLARVTSPAWPRKIKYRIYSDLAGISARLKLYPLAMSCYYRAVHPLEDTAASAIAADDLPVDTDELIGPSEPIRIEDLLAAFDDHKEVAAYALLVEVKQPLPGKRRAFTHINNVGHMFITLIKYNQDKSVVCRSFGFYPHKSTVFSATPIRPRSPSVIKDDSGHDWDEATGKFISARRFRKIVGILRMYAELAYDLNHNNCTDFGLTIARLGGIEIADAKGRWPLGKGNNPGSAGQSILEGKISNTDEEFADPLFVSTNNLSGYVENQ